jgi:hypothetical protein
VSLSHPALTTTGKKRGKQKFASAEAKARQMSLDQEWAILKSKHGAAQEEKKRLRGLGAPGLAYSLQPPPGRATPKIPSRDTGWVDCTKAPDKVYTGTSMVGVATMHKSNAVPVFSSEQAKDISNMKR